jgi:signal-transduction protein with cAMP-binding, CBS, and nucleotidyltransferase domain
MKMASKSISKTDKTVDINQLTSFLRGVELLNHLKEPDLARLADLCQLVRFHRAETIFSEAQPGGSLYVVMSGRVKIFGSSTQGRSKTFAYLEPGDFFGEMSLLDDEARSASASESFPSASWASWSFRCSRNFSVSFLEPMEIRLL